MARRELFLPLCVLLFATQGGSLGGVEALRGPGWAMAETGRPRREQGGALDRFPGPAALLGRGLQKRPSARQPCPLGPHRIARWVITVPEGQPSSRPSLHLITPSDCRSCSLLQCHGDPAGLAGLRAHTLRVRKPRHWPRTESSQEADLRPHYGSEGNGALAGLPDFPSCKPCPIPPLKPDQTSSWGSLGRGWGPRRQGCLREAFWRR